MLISVSTTIYPYGPTRFYSTEAEARFVSVVFPMYVGITLLLSRWLGILLFVVAAFAASALFLQALFNRNRSGHGGRIRG